MICLFLSPITTQASDYYKVFNAERFDSYIDIEYLNSATNYSANGEKQNLTSGSKFKDIQFVTSARYVLASDFGFYSGLRFGNVESTNLTNTRTNSSLHHIFLGADYQVVSKPTWSIYLDAFYEYANETVNLATDSALTSDGANEIKLQAVGTIKLADLDGFVRAGYNNRTDGFSSLMIYGAGVDYKWTTFGIGAEVRGFTSISDDQYTQSITIRENVTNRVSAGSKRYFAINPNRLEALMNLAYSIEKNWHARLSLGTTVSGSNTSEGPFAGVSLNWGFDGESKLRKKPIDKIKNNTSLPDDDPGFKIETNDGVDQNLFKPSGPVKKK